MWYVLLGGGLAILALAAASSGGPRRLKSATNPLPSLGTPKLYSSPFGMRMHPVLHRLKMHEGLDLPAPQGTPVVAPVDGKIAYAKPWDGASAGGTMLALDGAGEAAGYRFKFMHLSAIPIPAGTVVKRGDLIAFSGNTGAWTTGPHLHLEVEDRESKKEVDPLLVFPKGTFVSRAGVVAGADATGADAAGDLWEPTEDPEGLSALADADAVLDEAQEIQSTYGLGPEEALAIAEAADSVGGRGTHLARVMYAESRMNPRAVNASSGATGLIQWLPSSAQKLGTTTGRIARMSFLEQVALAERYLLAVASGEWAGGEPGLLDTQFKMGAAVFYPAWRDRSPRSVLPAKVQTANPGIRTMGDYMDRALAARPRRPAGDPGSEAEVVWRYPPQAPQASGVAPGDPTALGTTARAIFATPEVKDLVRRAAASGQRKLDALSLRDGLLLGSTFVGAHAVAAIAVAENPTLRGKVGDALQALGGAYLPVPGIPWLKAKANFDKANPGAGIKVEIRARRR